MKRLALLLAVGCACKGKENPPAPPPPPPTPASPEDATPPQAVDAVEAPKLVVTPDGIGPLQRLMWSQQSDNETADIIHKALAPLLPDTTTTVAEATAPDASKKRYWSVKRGDKELVKVLADPFGEKPRPAVMMVYTPEIPAADGTKVGDTVANLLAKNPAIYCYNDSSEPIVGTVRADVTCHVKTEKNILYVIDTTKRTIAQGELDPSTLSDLAIVAIVGMPR